MRHDDHSLARQARRRVHRRAGRRRDAVRVHRRSRRAVQDERVCLALQRHRENVARLLNEMTGLAALARGACARRDAQRRIAIGVSVAAAERLDAALPDGRPERALADAGLLPGDLYAERHAALAHRTIAVDGAGGLADRAAEVAVVGLRRDAGTAAAVAGAAARRRTELPVVGAADAAVRAADTAGAAIGVA